MPNRARPALACALQAKTASVDMRGMARPVLSNAACAAALLGAAAMAAACPSDSPQWRAQLLAQVNGLRAAGGSCGASGKTGALAPLHWSEALERISSAQARWLAELGEIAHTGRHGEPLAARADAASYPFVRVAENLALGYEREADVLAGWVGSESHCVNLFDAQVSELALSCVVSPSGPVWVLALGKPRRAHSADAMTPPPRQTSPS
jgi:uncharacterized protein YkwD